MKIETTGRNKKVGFLVADPRASVIVSSTKAADKGLAGSASVGEKAFAVSVVISGYETDPYNTVVPVNVNRFGHTVVTTTAPSTTLCLYRFAFRSQYFEFASNK